MNQSIPQHITWIITTMKEAGFEAFLVGGCVRDMLLNKLPSDWDVTTNASPDQIISTFEETTMKVVYENNFGTVGIINKEEEKNSSTYAVEITPYRTEGAYTDNRRPDEIQFSERIEDDLSRRDFTINAMAYDPTTSTLVDEFGGQKDLQSHIITTVGNPHERFGEDALRIMRALRFAAQLGFSIEEQTMSAIKEHAQSLENISKERIRDEFIKLIDAPYAADGLIAMEKLGLLTYVIPELEEGVGCEQGGIHAFDVWTHLIKSLQHATNKEYALHVKIAALFHDIGKPRTRRRADGRGTKEWTFYGHEVVGATISREIMKRLKFPKTLSEPVEKLVRYHMFFSDPESITLSAVRRMVRNVGPDLIWDLMNLRTCDRIGTGRPKEEPYRLRKYYAMIEEVMRDPISVGMLKINGDILISEMDMEPGPHMGWILHALLEEVLDDPQKNDAQYLRERAGQLYAMERAQLKELGEAGKEVKEVVDRQERKELHRKHKVD